MTRRDARYRLVWMPSLVLAGHWMREAGFATGQQVTVDVTDGKITITL